METSILEENKRKFSPWISSIIATCFISMLPIIFLFFIPLKNKSNYIYIILIK